MEEIKKLKEEIMDLIKDKDLDYIENDEYYNQILGNYTTLNQKYIKLYSGNHKLYNKKVENLQKQLIENPVWNLILELSSSDNKLKQTFNKLYSLNKISNQNKKLCKNIDAALISDINHYGKCQICKKKIHELKDIIYFDSEMAKDDIKSNILEKMKNSIQTSIISPELLEKYKKSVKKNSDNINALLDFIKNLSKDEKKAFITLIKKFFAGREVEILDINIVLSSLRAKKDKYKGITDFINSLKKEISEFQKKVPDINKKEWVFQL